MSYTGQVLLALCYGWPNDQIKDEKVEDAASNEIPTQNLDHRDNFSELNQPLGGWNLPIEANVLVLIIVI